MKNLIKICLLVCGVMRLCSADAQTEAMYYTSMGNFKVRLTDTLIPRTVDSFIARVSEKFYDHQIFHRVIDNFMIQGGDPLGTGYGGPGYTLPDEFNPTLKNVPGALAMANAGPNTSGSQFYVNLVTNAHLDNHYTVFGMVIENFTVVQSIGHVPTNSGNKPLTDVRLDSIRITKVYYPAAVHNVTNNTAVSIYPNPCRGVVNIDVPDMTTKVEIGNTVGRVVYCTTTKGATKIDVHEQPVGLYFVRLSNINGVSESKLVIQ